MSAEKQSINDNQGPPPSSGTADEMSFAQEQQENIYDDMSKVHFDQRNSLNRSASGESSVAMQNQLELQKEHL